MSLILHNPHSVLAVIQTRPEDILELRISSESSDAWSEVEAAARGAKIVIRDAKKNAGQTSPKEGGRMSGAQATVREREGVTADELFEGARERAGGKGLWLALDSLQDPQNVGAIFRTAAFFGVQGILLTQERSAPLSATAYDVASGGMEYVPFAQQINLQRAFEKAKEEGLWILGSSERAKESLAKIERDRPWLLVLGNEEKGMRRLTEEACDLVCAIEQRGEVGSLNVSVAAGIMISHLSGA